MSVSAILSSSFIPKPIVYLQECLYELSKRPDTQDKIRAELISFEEHNGRVPDYNDLMNSVSLPYFDAVIRETLRTKPVLMAITREVRPLA